MEFTPQQDLVAKKVLKAMSRVSTLEATGNTLCTLSSALALFVPFILSISTGDWSNIFLLFLYPCAVFPMSYLRHSSFRESGSGLLPKSLLPAIVVIIFMTLTNAPGWYWLIALGLIYSYHILFNELPFAQIKAKMAMDDPQWQELQLKIKNEKELK